MTTGAQVELGVRTGYATETTCKIVVASLAAGEITVSVTGIGNFAITPDEIVGAGFVGSTTITGLASFTQYSYAVTQGAKTASGSFMTAPAATDDYSLFFASCDKNANTSAHSTTGFWSNVRSYATTGALPTAAVFFADDHGYVDSMMVDDTAGTGLVVSHASGPQATGLAADYAIAYLCNLGMLGDATEQYVAWGRDEDRVWCRQHINCLPQWGDHEFINDFGFDHNNTTATALSGVGTATGVQVWAGGKAAWDAFMYPLMPTPFTGSYGWGMALGCVNLVAPDGITHANGAWDRTAAGIGVNDPSVLFGSTQINAILTYLNDNPQPFNLFGMAHSIRYLQAFVDGTDAVYNQGAQHPLYDHVLSEYQQLFTASGNTPKSLMENNATNGVAGVTVLLHGDYHHACVLKHEKAAYAGNLAENFYSVHLGTMNGSTNFTMPLAEGASYSGTTLEYDSGWTHLQHNYAGLRVDVYGSRTVKEMHVVLMDSTGAEAWKGRFVQRSSNSTVPETWEKPVAVGTSAKASAL